MEENETPSIEDIESVAKCHVITILIDPDSPYPEVDLGDVPPHAAICFFNQAVIALEEIMTPPQITYEGNIIYGVTSE